MKRPQEDHNPEDQPEAKRQKTENDEMEDLVMLATIMEIEPFEGPLDHCLFCEDYAMPLNYMCKDCALLHGVD
jgi:hypothetical protein